MAFKLEPKHTVIASRAGERAVARSLTLDTDQDTSEIERDLAADSFLALYTGTDENGILPDEYIEPSHAINRTIMQYALSSPDMRSMQDTTTNNLLESLGSTNVLWSYLKTDSAIKAALEKAEAARQARENADKERKQADAARKEADKIKNDPNARDDAKNLVEQIAQVAEERASIYEDTAEQFEAQAQATNEKLDQRMQSDVGKAVLKNAIKEGKEEGEKIKAITRGMGTESGASSAVNDPEEIMRLLKTYEAQIKRLADMVGRLRKKATDDLNALHDSRHGAITHMQLTRDFQRITAFERMKFAPGMPPILRTQTITKFVARGLPGYVPMQADEGRGSFVMMKDGSGSMRGKRDEVASAIALGTSFAMRDHPSEKRVYEMHTFGWNTDPFVSITSEDDLASHMKWATISPHGGTDFDYALNFACDRIEALAKKNKKGVDLVFVTDDYGEMSEQVVKRVNKLRAEGTRLVYIQIGVNRESENAKLIADQYMSLDDNALDDPESIVSSIIGTIASETKEKK